jgi:hypothetical protein
VVVIHEAPERNERPVIAVVIVAPSIFQPFSLGWPGFGLRGDL